MAYLVDKIVVGGLQTNCYILAEAESKHCAIIDPGADYKKIKGVIDKKNLVPLFIINTHGHPDHIMANNQFNLPVYIHKEDVKLLSYPNKSPVSDRNKIKLENLTITVIHTPGHTPGSICLLCKSVLFSGDTLFASGIGRTDLPGGNEQQLKNSIGEKILTLPDDTKVYPGHGPETTIGKEKEDNPWLQESRL